MNRDGARLTLSRTEPAQMTGATVLTVSRTLSKWAETGIVSRCPNGIIVQRVVKLQTQVNDIQAIQGSTSRQSCRHPPAPSYNRRNFPASVVSTQQTRELTLGLYFSH